MKERTEKTERNPSLLSLIAVVTVSCNQPLTYLNSWAQQADEPHLPLTSRSAKPMCGAHCTSHSEASPCPRLNDRNCSTPSFTVLTDAFPTACNVCAANANGIMESRKRPLKTVHHVVCRFPTRHQRPCNHMWHLCATCQALENPRSEHVGSVTFSTVSVSNEQCEKHR